jgi:ring-1,2-phenylacetyl-CoA epoxidase subunit PaaD
MSRLTAEKVLEWLREVKDPEIPVLSLVDLGVITGINIGSNEVTIEMTPTFVGCPALHVMQQEMREALSKRGISKVNIDVNFKNPWTSDRISESGREALKKFGLAPPPPRKLFMELDVLERAVCPRCGKDDTELRSAFGPTLCRAIHYCHNCREAFEQFKPL